ncbi:MAG: flippase [Candidatus Andersenbacteria bacterium]
MAQSIISNTAISGTGRVITILLGVATTAVVTRYLGVASFGSYTLLLSISTILQIAADFGLYLTLTRDISKPDAQEQHIFGTISALRLVLVGGLFILVGAGMAIIPQYRPLLIPFIVITAGITAQSLSQLLMGVYQKYKEVWKATIGDVVGRIAQLLIILAVVRAIPANTIPQSTAVLWVTIAFFVGAVLAYILHALFVPKINAWRWNISVGQWKVLAKNSWPLGLLLLLNVVYFRTDVIIISIFRPQVEVGWYGLAYRIIESGLFFPAMFGGLLLPQLSLLFAKKHIPPIAELLEQATRLVGIAGFLAAGALLVFAEDIIVFLSGVEFVSAAPLLRVLAVALGIMFVGNIFGFALIAFHKQKQLLTLYGLLVVLNLTTNLIFVPIWGAAAAAWTTLITEATATLGAGYLVSRMVPLSIPTKPLLLCGAVLLFSAGIGGILPASWHVLLRLAIFSSLYISGAVCVGLITRDNIHLLLSKKLPHEA